MRIKFREAWKLWRSGGKTMLGETITIWTLIHIALLTFFESSIHFFTEIFWKWIWGRKKKKEE